jgi:hypothetical protein
MRIVFDIFVRPEHPWAAFESLVHCPAASYLSPSLPGLQSYLNGEVKDLLLPAPCLLFCGDFHSQEVAQSLGISEVSSMAAGKQLARLSTRLTRAGIVP